MEVIVRGIDKDVRVCVSGQVDVTATRASRARVTVGIIDRVRLVKAAVRIDPVSRVAEGDVVDRLNVSRRAGVVVAAYALGITVRCAVDDETVARARCLLAYIDADHPIVGDGVLDFDVCIIKVAEGGSHASAGRARAFQ